MHEPTYNLDSDSLEQKWDESPVEERHHDLKGRVNTLLFTSLPGHITLDQMEEIACSIIKMILDAEGEK